MRPDKNLLNILGVIYGLCWGLVGTVAVGLVMGIPPKGSGLVSLLGTPWAEVIFFVTCVATGIPVGLAVTHVCAPWLSRGSGWKLLWVAPVSLLMGTMLLGLLHAAIVQGYLLATKENTRDYLKNFVGFPYWYALGSFLILYVPVPLAFLNCWHLRRTLRTENPANGALWPIKPAARP